MMLRASSTGGAGFIVAVQEPQSFGSPAEDAAAEQARCMRGELCGPRGLLRDDPQPCGAH
jgi:hypothetical protein